VSKAGGGLNGPVMAATWAFCSLSFPAFELKLIHQNRHLREILGRPRLDSDTGTEDGALWR
jgi:hypothetical protein